MRRYDGGYDTAFARSRDIAAILDGGVYHLDELTHHPNHMKVPGECNFPFDLA